MFLGQSDFKMSMVSFFQKMSEKMEKGAEKYGRDTYLSRPASSILAEAEDELVDVANYCFMTWQRINKLVKKLEEKKIQGGAEE